MRRVRGGGTRRERRDRPRPRGEAALAVRVLAAADAWWVGTPRSVPERRNTETEAVEARARAEPGARRHAAERATGGRLTPDEVVGLLADR